MSHTSDGPSFSIRILEQRFELPDPRDDFYTRGRILLQIGGVTIEDGREEYGISEAALGLLRTLNSDFRGFDYTRLIPHGCGLMLMMNCGIGIEWFVTHQPGHVWLHDVVRYDTNKEADAQRFSGIECAVSSEHYREQIVTFAHKAREPFIGAEKRFTQVYEEPQYRKFWSEYESLLQKFGSAA